MFAAQENNDVLSTVRLCKELGFTVTAKRVTEVLGLEPDIVTGTGKYWSWSKVPEIKQAFIDSLSESNYLKNIIDRLEIRFMLDLGALYINGENSHKKYSGKCGVLIDSHIPELANTDPYVIDTLETVILREMRCRNDNETDYNGEEDAAGWSVAVSRELRRLARLIELNMLENENRALIKVADYGLDFIFSINADEAKFSNLNALAGKADDKHFCIENISAQEIQSLASWALSKIEGKT